jgi:hypothetical protein
MRAIQDLSPTHCGKFAELFQILLAPCDPCAIPKYVKAKTVFLQAGDIYG